MPSSKYCAGPGTLLLLGKLAFLAGWTNIAAIFITILNSYIEARRFREHKDPDPKGKIEGRLF